ncbi:DivIVA domain-containing protein [Streptomyces sp. NPDC052109]|uniref:DivIVA domain-containing protein n=1 Tax=Streptomyces sp. NPDC052109 TaxID=3155527 RepID=UPI00342A9ECF
MADDFPGFQGFEIARRGYDRTQVDAYLTRLASGTASETPPVFDIVRRGYDRSQVDARVSQLLNGGAGR